MSLRWSAVLALVLVLLWTGFTYGEVSKQSRLTGLESCLNGCGNIKKEVVKCQKRCRTQFQKPLADDVSRRVHMMIRRTPDAFDTLYEQIKKSTKLTTKQFTEPNSVQTKISSKFARGVNNGVLKQALSDLSFGFSSSSGQTLKTSGSCQSCLNECITKKRGPSCYGTCALRSSCKFDDVSIAPNLLN